MSRSRAVLLPLLSVCLLIVATLPVSAASQTGGALASGALPCVGLPAAARSGPTSGVLRLSALDLARPTARAMCQARLALQAHVVVAAAGPTSSLSGILGLQLPQASVSVSSRVASVFQGVRLDHAGVMHVYQGYAAAGGEARAAAGLNQWISEQANARTSTLAASAPSNQAWTQLASTVTSFTDSWNDYIFYGMDDYRLNDINSGGEWYLFATRTLTSPGYLGCGGSNCGPYIFQRNITMTAGSPVSSLIDHGPSSTITTSSTSYTVGVSLSAGTDVGVGVNASTTQTWDQPSVTTYDQSSGLRAAWQEAFSGPTLNIAPPPATASGSFQSDQAAIFQAPEGTTSFSLFGAGSYAAEKDTFYSCGLFGWATCESSAVQGATVSISLNVRPPAISVSPTSLVLSSGTSGSFGIQATIPGSTQGLTWDITNDQSWLALTSLVGNGSANVVATVLPKTKKGSVAYLNINTSPAYAAPSVERGPIVLKVTVH